MDDAKDEDHAVGLDDVVHHPVVADAKSMEGIGRPLDRLGPFAADPAGRCYIVRELFERGAKAATNFRRELLERAGRCGGELDVVGLQSRSFRLVVLPLA